jgi:hypothetical protein
MKLLTFRRLKIKPTAESKNLLPQARTRMDTDEQAKTKDLTCVSGWRDNGSGYIQVGTFNPSWWSLPELKNQPIVSVGVKTQDKRSAGPTRIKRQHLVPIRTTDRD